MTTGIGAPFSSFCVWALNSLQNSIMLRPRWPSAGPIGGEGLAAPAGTCNFRNPVTFFAITHSVSGADVDGWQPPHLPRFFTCHGRALPRHDAQAGNVVPTYRITGTNPARTKSIVSPLVRIPVRPVSHGRISTRQLSRVTAPRRPPQRRR